jgi:hypothetical protein
LRIRSLEDAEFEKSTDIREIKQLSLSIKLRISKVSNEVEITMTWLIDDLNDLKENFPRTIILSSLPALLISCTRSRTLCGGRNQVKQYYNNNGRY